MLTRRQLRFFAPNPKTQTALRGPSGYKLSFFPRLDYEAGCSARSVAMNGGEVTEELFHKFFEGWLGEQRQLLDALVAASRGQNGYGRAGEEGLRPLLDHVIHRYEHFYNMKARFAEKNITAVFSPSWLSSLENAFLWVGGWRPSAACHLLFSKLGQELEARLAEMVRGLRVGGLADLDPDQLDKVDALQMEIVTLERRIGEKLAKQQGKVADGNMVELSSLVSEAMRSGQNGVDVERVEEVLAPKKESLVELLHMADKLRVETLKKVMQILTPTQGMHFLIGAAELLLTVHHWGKEHDAAAAR